MRAVKYSYNIFRHRILEAEQSSQMPSGEEFISTGCDRTYGCVADTREEAIKLRGAELRGKVDKVIAWHKRETLLAEEILAGRSPERRWEKWAGAEAGRLAGCVARWSENLAILKSQMALPDEAAKCAQ